MFEEWKKIGIQHYMYYNLLEKMIVGMDLTKNETEHKAKNQEMTDKLMGKIRNIGMELHRAIPNEWNAFMEICMAGAITE